MKRSLILLSIVLILAGILTSCIQEEPKSGNGQLPTKIPISTIMDKITISDFTDYGLWSVSLPKYVLEERIEKNVHYAIKVSDIFFELKPNIADSSRLIALIPGSVSKEQIEMGLMSSYNFERKMIPRSQNLSVEKVIITGEETRNATNTYEMTLIHYIQFKDAHAYLVYDSDGNLIRPEYIKSNEENAYTLQRYYNAKQVASEHNPDAALKFLRGRDDHEELLFFGNANRVEYDSTITYQEPDQRDRLRELGPMGEFSNPENIYNLEQDNVNSQTVIHIRSDRLDSQYDNATFYFSELKESTECHFSKSETINVYTTPIAFDITQSTELIKNTRFNCSKAKIIHFNSEDIFQTGYDNLNTAVSDANSGDIIRVFDHTHIKNTNNEAKVTGEVYINEKDITLESLYGDLYTVDMENLSTRAFRINNSTTTIKNAIITNGSLSMKVGGGVYANYSNLFISESIIATNTVSANSTGYYGGGLYFSSSDVTINNSTITNNRIDKGQGGGISFSSSEDQNELILYQCCISENISSKNGAGLYISGVKSTEIKNCSIVNNKISGDDSIYLNGGGISACGNDLSLIISDTLIASNSALKYGGGLFCGLLSATITNTHFTNNFSQKEGGAVYFDDYAGGQNTVFYSNTITDNNSTDTQAKGIYIEDRSTIYNADGNGWNRTNSPPTAISDTENTNNNLNTYSGQGAGSGNDISFEGQ